MVSLVLLLISPPRPIKIWYFLVLISFPVWTQILLSKQPAALPLWFYGLPFVWVTVTLWIAFPKTNPEEPPTQAGEPRTTIEHLHGSAGTSEALRIYFTLVFLVSVAGLLLFKIVEISPYQ